MTSPVSLEELIRSVNAQSPLGTELDRLANAVAVSEELGSVADDLVGHFVDLARAAGCSWSQIGKELGVSKQAAQQRFVASRVHPSAMTPRAAAAISQAQEEARRLNNNYIGTEHLLLGAIHNPEALAPVVLTGLGVTADAIRAAIEAYAQHGTGPPPPGSLPFTPKAKKALDLSMAEALALGHNYIGTEHFLLGLLREGEGLAAKVMARLGLDVEKTKDAVITALSGYTST